MNTWIQEHQADNWAIKHHLYKNKFSLKNKHVLI